MLSKAVRRVASVVDRRVVVVRWSVWAQYALARVTEWTMKVPLVDLRPRRMFTAEQIRERLPGRRGFGWRDLRVGG
ncbi:hypothetical protein [Agromyces laixinhei]|uniref:hypothetical protein n=1 Tax=Agromyces laixinhei TaxID=2585717 RepID=UPI0012EE4DA2|nr:hypothetical protein [Agromyces laixinhei]